METREQQSKDELYVAVDKFEDQKNQSESKAS